MVGGHPVSRSQLLRLAKVGINLILAGGRYKVDSW
jgi:hypothetical protein